REQRARDQFNHEQALAAKDAEIEASRAREEAAKAETAAEKRARVQAEGEAGRKPATPAKPSAVSDTAKTAIKKQIVDHFAKLNELEAKGNVGGGKRRGAAATITVEDI